MKDVEAVPRNGGFKGFGDNAATGQHVAHVGRMQKTVFPFPAGIAGVIIGFPGVGNTDIGCLPPAAVCFADLKGTLVVDLVLVFTVDDE